MTDELSNKQPHELPHDLTLDLPHEQLHEQPHTQHLAVLGSPVSHSLSPRIHAAAYRTLGLPWHYEARECGVPGLESFLASRDDTWRGFSVTMPLKAEAHRLSAVRDDVAEASGVVNTLFRLAGDAGWAGFNTDVPGLAAALVEAGVTPRRTIVLGAGATAVSAVLAARQIGAEHITVLARRSEAAAQLASAVQCHSAVLTPEFVMDPKTTLVISTLPGTAGAELQVPEQLTRVPLFDVAYDPWPSPLALRWQQAGTEAHSGLGMLLHQAVFQVRIFVHGDPGVPLDRETEVVAAMREAMQQAMREAVR